MATWLHSLVVTILHTLQVDLVKDSGQQYFIQYLDSNDSTSSTDSRAQAAFVLAVICDGHPRGQTLCAGAGLLGVCLNHLRQSMASLHKGSAKPLLLIKWLCLCLGKLCEDMPEVNAASTVSGLQKCICHYSSLNDLTLMQRFNSTNHIHNHFL